MQPLGNNMNNPVLHSYLNSDPFSIAINQDISNMSNMGLLNPYLNNMNMQYNNYML
jgi:hypothetical protein